MRTVSFVDRVDFDFEGNVMNKAFTIGDVDNDNNNEIAIGNTSGDLFIFKGIQDIKPWAKASKLGMIACLEVGDVTNRGLNCLLSLSTEGWCHIFYLTSDSALCPTVFTEGDIGFDATEYAPDNPQMDSLNLPSTEEKSSQQTAPILSHNPIQQLTFSQPQSQPSHLVLKPAYVQKLSSNAKACVIADIDGDGYNELVVSYTDRVVRSFKWVPEIPVQSVSSSVLTPTNFCFGALKIHEKWKLAGQVGSMSVHKNQVGLSTVFVSQPGGSYVSLICSAGEEPSLMDSSYSEVSNKICCGPSVSYHPLGSLRARNPNVSTEVISNIVSTVQGAADKESEKISFSAICTLDGTLTLIDEDKIIWSLCVDHQLFAITKLDVTGDGTEEVVACSWDGQTYIVNLSKEVVSFHFKENVAAFCSGKFSVAKDCPSSVLCYATLSGKLVVFYNIHLKSVGISNMVDAVRARPDVVEELRDLDVDPANEEQLKKFLRKVMYGTGK